MSTPKVSMNELQKIANRRRRLHQGASRLRPLADRLTPAQIEAREIKIWARRTMAEQIMARHNLLSLTMQTFFRRGLVSRLWWLVTGK